MFLLDLSYPPVPFLIPEADLVDFVEHSLDRVFAFSEFIEMLVDEEHSLVYPGIYRRYPVESS